MLSWGFSGFRSSRGYYGGLVALGVIGLWGFRGFRVSGAGFRG